MTEREIDAFLAIVRTGSISGASKELYVTQPALSRRICALEQELGYGLILRRKGQRTIELTDQGRAFIPLAEKWRGLWKETLDLGKVEAEQWFHVASVGSVGAYILPGALERFMAENPDCPLTFHNYHSFESYGYVERGEVDLAFVSDQMFSATVDTVPAFKGKMALVTSGIFQGNPSPSLLDSRKEIRLPWEPAYDQWHDYWFGPRTRPRVILDQMSLMEHFLREPGSWVIAPEYIARILVKNQGVYLYELEDGPPESIIYYLVKKNSRNRFRESFLKVTKDVLGEMEGITVLL